MENQELELYKLIMTPDESDKDILYVQEFGWVNDSEFLVWVSYIWMKEFIDQLTNIFGYEIFDDGGIDANVQCDCICIDLCEVIDDSIIEVAFPKTKFEH